MPKKGTEKGLMRQLALLKCYNYSGCIYYTIPHNDIILSCHLLA
jgi:hypothetical protein